MRKIENRQQFEQAAGSAPLAVVVYKADWCPDCHFIEPFMPELADGYGDRILFLQADRDECPEWFAEQNVLGIPSFIAYKNGTELIRFVSKLRKTREEIETFLQRAIAVAGGVTAGNENI